ncbi:MAG: hypothetical protein ACI85K_000410 [Hyphomicrobiaceae bacterium]|jgi:hypothetical protein
MVGYRGLDFYGKETVRRFELCSVLEDVKVVVGTGERWWITAVFDRDLEFTAHCKLQIVELCNVDGTFSLLIGCELVHLRLSVHRQKQGQLQDAAAMAAED